MESLLDFRMAQTLTTEAALGLHSQHPDRQIEILRKDSRPALNSKKMVGKFMMSLSRGKHG